MSTIVGFLRIIADDVEVLMRIWMAMPVMGHGSRSVWTEVSDLCSALVLGLVVLCTGGGWSLEPHAPKSQLPKKKNETMGTSTQGIFL